MVSYFTLFSPLPFGSPSISVYPLGLLFMILHFSAYCLHIKLNFWYPIPLGMLLLIVNLFQLCQLKRRTYSKVTWLSGIITGRWVEVVTCGIFLFLSNLASENGILKPQGITERQLVCVGFYYISSTKPGSFIYILDEVLSCKHQNPL